MGPGVLRIAGQRVDVNLLAGVQIVQGFREQVDGIIHQRGFGLRERKKEKKEMRMKPLYGVCFVVNYGM